MWNTCMPDLPKSEKEKCSSIIGESMIEYIDEPIGIVQYQKIAKMTEKITIIQIYQNHIKYHNLTNHFVKMDI